MAIPQWLAILMGVVVLGYGGFRMWLAVAGPSNEDRAKARSGMMALSRRTHGLVAVLLWIAGAMLLGGAFGWKPWGGGGATTAAPDPTPHRTGLPVQ